MTALRTVRCCPAPPAGVTDGLEQAAAVRQKAVTSNKDKILFISLLFFPFKCSSLSSSAKRSELLEHFLGNSPAPRVIAVAGIQHTGSIKWPKPVVHVPVRTPCVSCHNRVPVGQISRHALPWDRKIDIKGGSQEYVGVRGERFGHAGQWWKDSEPPPRRQTHRLSPAG